MAAMTLALQPSSASRLHAAFRSPWTDARAGKPASRHLCLNQCVKLIGVKRRPSRVVRNVRCSAGVASSAARRSGCAGIASVVPVLRWRMWIKPPRTCWRPIWITSASRAWLPIGCLASNRQYPPRSRCRTRLTETWARARRPSDHQSLRALFGDQSPFVPRRLLIATSGIGGEQAALQSQAA